MLDMGEFVDKLHELRQTERQFLFQLSNSKFMLDLRVNDSIFLLKREAAVLETQNIF